MIAQAIEAYKSALHLGQREFRACVAHGQNPYPALLSDELPDINAVRQEHAGIIEVPAEQFIGVGNASRQEAFSAGFMPLLGETSEFAGKWIALCNAHLENGIRDAVKAYDYMNRYFVEEGNKRVSVLKYLGASHIAADVTRLIPPKNGEKENNIYYEFLDFHRQTGIPDIYFSEEGRFARLLQTVGKNEGQVWTDDEKMALRAAYQRFFAVFNKYNAKRFQVSCSDAFLAYADICGYETLRTQTEDEIAANLMQMRDEVVVLGRTDAVKLSLNPMPASQAPLLNKLLPVHSAELRTAFLFEKTVETSPWTAVHDAGRRRMERNFKGKVGTVSYDRVMVGQNDEEILERAIAEGADVIFTTTPKMISASVKAAVQHPGVKILNCSLNMVHPSVRTYYARVYEAKFLIGAIAGAMCENDTIGYLADYPIFGVPANINAFAKGVQMVNPRARVQLEWTSIAGHDPYTAFRDNGVTLISGRDLRSLEWEVQSYGLYQQHVDGVEWIALPYWHWGKMYTEIVSSILCGTWKTEATRAEEQAINYWWGLSSGVLDVTCSGSLPTGTVRLMEVLRESILSGKLDALAPFPEPYLTEMERTTLKSPSPEDILRMDTLAENVVGSIPEMEILIEEAKPLVRLQGLRAQEAQRL
ncbi:MAG: BMP family ABC transporter substrate-binding protein [Clostridia bacterium]